MRQKRAKAYRKLMALYSMSFGFRQPYQILIDSEMCKTAISQNVDFVKQLGIVLQGTVKPMITQCCIHELYLQGKAQQPAVDLAKTFERRKCNHKEAIAGDDCLSSVIGDTNKHRYVVATQSQPLRAKLRSIPGVPILHVNRSVMILEPPSDTTLRAKALVETEALNPSTSETAKLKAVAAAPPEPPKKRKGPKGPNPLSVKKKKKVVDQQPAKSKDKEKGKAKAPMPKAIQPPAETDVVVGEKRKRGDDDDGPVDGVPEEKAAHSGRKRRRKRKGTTVAEISEPPATS
ncbi:Fcf1-domain-containing protein [Dentipellis sp. KUC8613]|nr:Fcf1-domain-containing protein [Dentipellis sp. KUC8613]